jgi:hypothetical protein
MDDTGQIDSATSGIAPSVEGTLSYVPNAIHLMRTTQQMQLQLSQMADQKASILMGATFVSFTISIGQLASGNVSPALIILATFSLLAVVLSMMVVMPQLGVAGTRKLEGNILFFGEFARMTEADFMRELKGKLVSDDHLYSAMTRDIYQNGQVMAFRKYPYLTLAYRTFLVGLILSFVTLVVQQLLLG